MYLIQYIRKDRRLNRALESGFCHIMSGHLVIMVGHAERGLRNICSILYIVYVLYALFNRQPSTKHPVGQFYSGISLSASSNVVAGTTLRPRHGSTRRHYNLQGIFLASSRLCKQTGFALWLLYLSGDLELNPGPVNAKLQRNLKIAHLNARSIKNREHYIYPC